MPNLFHRVPLRTMTYQCVHDLSDSKSESNKRVTNTVQKWAEKDFPTMNIAGWAKIKGAQNERLTNQWWLMLIVCKYILLADAENINWFVIYWYLVCFSLLFIWRGTNWGQNLYKNNTKKRKHNFLELSNSQNRMLTKRKRKNSLHSYHNLIPSSINSNPDSRCIECRLLEKRNYRFSLVSCIFKKVLNQTLYNFIMTDIG